MAVFQLFSKRQKKLRGEVPDIYQYTDFPHAFRVQVIHIIRDTVGVVLEGAGSDKFYQFIHDTLCREYGRFRLLDQRCSYAEQVGNFFLSTQNSEEVLDVIELAFRTIDTWVRPNHYNFFETKQTPDEAIAELNERFNEQGAEPTTVPASVASYVLHLTATTLLFLAQAESDLH